MNLDIKKFPDPILRAPATEVTDFSMETQNLIDNMIETLRETGVGLAAPQVGISQKILVAELEIKNSKNKKRKGADSFPLTVLCNPKIVKSSKEKSKMVEGCLSFPGIELLIKRPKSITVEAQDRYGKYFKLEAKGFMARVLQHEIDHLYSVLFIDRIVKTKIIFIGTGTLGVESLKLLASDPQYNIAMTITSQVDTGNGRKSNINPILETAKKLKLPILETKNINDPKIIEKIKRVRPELGIMADFGQIIKQEILEIPKYGIVNIHPSLLPKYRGPSPIKQTILEGDKITGISLIKTDMKMDAGEIIAQGEVKLRGTESNTVLKDYLGKVAANFLLNSIPYYLAGDLKPYPQEEESATYTRLFKKEDGCVDKKTSAVIVERKIRAFDDWPKVYTKLTNGKVIQITAAHFDKEGKLVIDRVKPESKQEIAYNDFRQGYREELTFVQ